MSAISTPLPTPPDNFSTQIASATVSSSAITFNVDDASGLPTEGVGVLFKKDSDGEVVAGSIEFIHWTGVSGNTINLSDTGDRGLTGSDSGAQAYVADDYFEVWVSSYYYDSQYDAFTAEHNTDGTHGAVTATSVASSGAVSGTTGAFTGIVSISEHLDVVDGKSIRDGNDNELVTFEETASAVNEVSVTNAATGGNPSISATGGDTNINIALLGKGTGQVVQTINRQGGSATNWTTSGTTNYTANALIQCGSITVTSQASPATLTFPIAFKTSTVPTIITTVSTAATTVNSTAAANSNTQATIYTDDASNVRTVNWIAIGEAA